MKKILLNSIFALSLSAICTVTAQNIGGTKAVEGYLMSQDDMEKQYGAPYDWTKTRQPERPYFHKFDQSIVYQLILARKSEDGNGSIVFLNFEQALDVIRRFDVLTCGAPKIVYLCGVQNNGHDSKYPYCGAFNDALKRPEDKSGLDGLKWLIGEARKFNTVVSLQLNMFDAYEFAG